MKALEDLREVHDDIGYVLSEYGAFSFTDLQRHDRGLWGGILKTIERMRCEKLRHHTSLAFKPLLEKRPETIDGCIALLQRIRANLSIILQCLTLVQTPEDPPQEENREASLEHFSGEHINDGPAVAIQRDTWKERALEKQELKDLYSPAMISGRVAKVDGAIRGYYLYRRDADPVPILDFAVEMGKYRYAAARALATDLLTHLEGTPKMLSFEAEKSHCKEFCPAL